jgi:hypothetical protein
MRLFIPCSDLPVCFGKMKNAQQTTAKLHSGPDCGQPFPIIFAGAARNYAMRQNMEGGTHWHNFRRALSAGPPGAFAPALTGKTPAQPAQKSFSFYLRDSGHIRIF